MTSPALSQDGRQNRRFAAVLRHLPGVARVLLGFVFLASGAFGLLIALGALPMPKPSAPQPEALTAFVDALNRTGYFLPFLKGTELLAGALLLSNRFVPLGLLLLAPVVLNILALHAFLAPSGLVAAVLITALEGYLGWAYRKAFGPLFVARSSPD